MPPSGGDQTCKKWANKQVEKFREGKLGNSAGFHKKFMSKKKWNRLMRAAVKRYKADHPRQFEGVAARDWDSWCGVCDYFFSAERCMATGLHPAGCAEAEEDSEEIHRMGREVAWFTLQCGGGAVIGGGATRHPGGVILGGMLACGWGVSAEWAKCHHTSRPMPVREPVC